MAMGGWTEDGHVCLAMLPQMAGKEVVRKCKWREGYLAKVCGGNGGKPPTGPSLPLLACVVLIPGAGEYRR